MSGARGGTNSTRTFLAPPLMTQLGHWPITIRIFWTCRSRPNEQLNFSVYAAFRIFVLQDRPHPFAGLLE